eukprot:evm.model.NODE_6825_length_32477_cov_17.962835.1
MSPPQDTETKQLQIAPSSAYPDILEVRHVNTFEDYDGVAYTDECHQYPQHRSVALPSGLAHIQEQDRLTHVNGQPVFSIEQAQRWLSQSGDVEEIVTVRLLRKQNPYAEYVNMDDPSTSYSSSSISSSGESSSYHYSSSPDDNDQYTSILTMLMTGGGCISFSSSSSPSSSSSLMSTSASTSNSSNRLYQSRNVPLQPYESWGDEASLEHAFYGPLWCLPVFIYLIQAGDTLPSLARAFGLKIDVLRRDNRDKFKLGEPAGVLIPGQKLRVRNIEYDGKATAALVARGGGFGGRGREGGRVGGGVAVRVPSSEEEVVEYEEGLVFYWGKGQKHQHRQHEQHQQKQQQQQQQQWRRQHVVVGGDTIKGLCARYGVSELEIRRANRNYFSVGERSLLREGMCLIIYPGGASPASVVAAAPSYTSPSAVGALWKRKGRASSPLSSSPRTSSSGSNSSSSSSGSRGSGGGKEGGKEGGGDGRPVLFPVVGVGGVV